MDCVAIKQLMTSWWSVGLKVNLCVQANTYSLFNVIFCRRSKNLKQKSCEEQNGEATGNMTALAYTEETIFLQ